MDNRWQRGAHDGGLLIARLMLAVVFLFHGAQKLLGWFDGPGLGGFAAYLSTLGVPLPGASALLAAGAEAAGGLAVATGVGLRAAAVPLVVTMLVAAFVGHDGFAAASGGMEYPLTLAVVTAGLALVGPGRFALELPRSLRLTAPDRA